MMFTVEVIGQTLKENAELDTYTVSKGKLGLLVNGASGAMTWIIEYGIRFHDDVNSYT